MIGLKQIFTWWHNQTLGTFVKTFFFGKYEGKDEFGNKYYSYKKKNQRWVIYKGEIESSRIPNDWFLWIHHTIDDLPKDKTKYSWQKEHKPNVTGTPNSRGIKIKKELKKKYETWN